MSVFYAFPGLCASKYILELSEQVSVGSQPTDQPIANDWWPLLHQSLLPTSFSTISRLISFDVEAMVRRGIFQTPARFLIVLIYSRKTSYSTNKKFTRASLVTLVTNPTSEDSLCKFDNPNIPHTSMPIKWLVVTRQFELLWNVWQLIKIDVCHRCKV